MDPTGVPEYRVYTTPSRVEHWRHLIEIAAFVIAAVWAFYVFVYQERIKPASEPARVQFSSTTTHEALPNNKELVEISMTLKNTGSSDAALGALLVNAYGVRYPGSSGGEELLTIPNIGVAVVNRGVKGSTPVLLYSHLILWTPLSSQREAKIPPGQDVSLNETFVVERGKYDTVRQIHADCYQRYDNTLVTAYHPKRSPDGGFDVQDVLHQSKAHAGIRCTGNYPNGSENAL